MGENEGMTEKELANFLIDTYTMLVEAKNNNSLDEKIQIVKSKLNVLGVNTDEIITIKES